RQRDVCSDRAGRERRHPVVGECVLPDEESGNQSAVIQYTPSASEPAAVAAAARRATWPVICLAAKVCARTIPKSDIDARIPSANSATSVSSAPKACDELQSGSDRTRARRPLTANTAPSTPGSAV